MTTRTTSTSDRVRDIAGAVIATLSLLAFVAIMAMAFASWFGA